MPTYFLSSTFQDMQKERDLLQQDVMPTLRQEAEQYGDTAEIIDLRWGLDTSRRENWDGMRKILFACMDEIDRNRPYMIVFLGNRYGYIPDAALVRELAEKYRIPFSDTDGKSVTALEILYGALHPAMDAEKCVVCIRKLNPEEIPEAERGRYFQDASGEAAGLEEIKRRLRQRYGEAVIEYTAAWNPENQSLERFNVNGKPLPKVLLERLRENSSEEWAAAARLSKPELANQRIWREVRRRSAAFRGRTAYLARVKEALLSGGTRNMILRGAPGSGKTSFLCALASQLRDEGREVCYIPCSQSRDFENAEQVLRHLVYEAEKALDERSTPSTTKSNYLTLKIRLEELCQRMTEDRHWLVLIDAPDCLDANPHRDELDFLPLLGAGVRCLLTCGADFALPEKCGEAGAFHVEDMPTLSREEIDGITRSILRTNAKDLYQEVAEELYGKDCAGNPLYLSMAAQLLNLMGEGELSASGQSRILERNLLSPEEEAKLPGSEGQRKIIANSIRLIRALPDDIGAAAAYVMDRGARILTDDWKSLEFIFRFLAVSRNGLRLDDLQNIIHMRKIPFAEETAADLLRLLNYLSVLFVRRSDGRIDFSHSVIRDAILDSGFPAQPYEACILQYLKELPTADSLRNSEGMYYAQCLDDKDFALALLADAALSREETALYGIQRTLYADKGAFLRAVLSDRLRRILYSKEELNTKRDLVSAVVSFFYTSFHGLMFDTGAGQEIFAQTMRTLHNLFFFGNLPVFGTYALLRGMNLNDWTEKIEPPLETGGHAGLGSLTHFCQTRVREANALYRRGKVDKAERLCKKALAVGESAVDKHSNASFLCMLATAYGILTDCELHFKRAKEAGAYAQNYLTWAEREWETRKTDRDHIQLATAHCKVADCRCDPCASPEREDWEAAYAEYQKAANIYQQCWDKSKTLEALQNLVISSQQIIKCCFVLDEMEQAESYVLEAERRAVLLESVAPGELTGWSVGGLYAMLAEVMIRKGNLERAEALSEKALYRIRTAYRKNPSDTLLLFMGNLYAEVAERWHESGHPEAAAKYYREILDCLDSAREHKSLMRLSTKATLRERLEALESERNEVTPS